jgi:hypothetical protein
LLFFELTLSISGRIFDTIGINGVIFFLFFLSSLIEIMINIERALYFSEGYEKIKKVSPYLICFFILILSLVIFTPNFLSLKLVPEDQIYILNKTGMPSDFASSNLGKIILLLCYILEGPIIFFLLIVTNIIAIISYKKFNQRNELIERANNVEMMTEGEIRKKNKIEKMDRKLLIMTSYLSLISILAELIKFTGLLFYFIVSNLSPKTIGWLAFSSLFSISLKQFTSIIVYYNYKMFREELKNLIKKFF